jgi:ribonucleotide reductase beta subunit family protein with ferritin-like domain
VGWTGPRRDRAERLIAFAAVEGVLFSASFSILQWLRDQRLLTGVTTLNSFIVRDEGVHTDFTCCLVRRYLCAPPSPRRAHEIVAEAVALADRFAEDSLPAPLPGLSAPALKQYLRFIADGLLQAMGYEPAYRAGNPFAFMDVVALNAVTKVNFFERLVTQYQGVASAGASALALDETPLDPDSSDDDA